MPESYFQWSERQAEQERRDERWAREDRFRDSGPTRYTIKKLLPPRNVSAYLMSVIHDSQEFTLHETDALVFNSATEASLYALEHNITGVEIVAV